MNLTDVSNSRLARWRMQFLSFSVTIKYRKGSQNNVADAISRLPTFGYTVVEPDLDILCLLVDNGQIMPLPTSHLVDSASWIEADWELDAQEETVSCQHNDALVVKVSQITFDELRRAQEEDDDCIHIRQNWEHVEPSPYVEDDRGIVCRRSPIDGALGA